MCTIVGRPKNDLAAGVALYQGIVGEKKVRHGKWFVARLLQATMHFALAYLPALRGVRILASKLWLFYSTEARKIVEKVEHALLICELEENILRAAFAERLIVAFGFGVQSLLRLLLALELLLFVLRLKVERHLIQKEHVIRFDDVVKVGLAPCERPPLLFGQRFDGGMGF